MNDPTIFRQMGLSVVWLLPILYEEGVNLKVASFLGRGQQDLLYPIERVKNGEKE
jgi:hypothetical protein